MDGSRSSAGGMTSKVYVVQPYRLNKVCMRVAECMLIKATILDEEGDMIITLVTLDRMLSRSDGYSMSHECCCAPAVSGPERHAN